MEEGYVASARTYQIKKEKVGSLPSAENRRMFMRKLVYASVRIDDDETLLRRSSVVRVNKARADKSLRTR